MIEVPLNKGFTAFIDDEDLPLIEGSSAWYAVTKGAVTYAARTLYDKNRTPKRFRQYMHRLIKPKIDRIDHLDGNGLNNTKGNLRAATASQNAVNSKMRSTNTSGYRGVTFNKNANKWLAQIRINSKNTYLGLFECPIEAAKAYNKEAVEHFGEYAKINHFST